MANRLSFSPKTDKGEGALCCGKMERKLNLLSAMSTRALPVELCDEIIKKSISLPTFLDPRCLPEVTDPLHKEEIEFRESPDYHSDGEYWNMEKHRNVLRRVSKSWDWYLRRFDHRYVRMDDVCHGRVPKEALRTACRIYFSACRTDVRPYLI